MSETLGVGSEIAGYRVLGLLGRGIRAAALLLVQGLRQAEVGPGGTVQLARTTTLAGYRGYIDRSILPSLGNLQVGRLDAATLDTFYARLRRQGGKDGRLVAGPRADVEHPLGAVQREQRADRRDDVRLGDRLAVPDRKRTVVVGAMPELLRNEQLTGHGGDRREYPVVGNTAAAEKCGELRPGSHARAGVRAAAAAGWVRGCRSAADRSTGGTDPPMR